MKQRYLFQTSILIGLLLLSRSATAELNGFLFSSPEQRAYLDFLRQEFLARSEERGFNIMESEVPEIPADAAPAAPAPTYTFGGISTRRNGDLVIWLNGQRYTETDLPAGLSLVIQDGQRSLLVSYAGNRYRLKPGQTVDLGSAEGVVENFTRLPTTAEPLTKAGVGNSADDNHNPAPADGAVGSRPELPESGSDTNAASATGVTELADSIRALPADSLANLIETLRLTSVSETDHESAEDAEDELE
jgi:hypothetical protein